MQESIEPVEIVCPKCQRTEIVYLPKESIPNCEQYDVPMMLRDEVIGVVRVYTSEERHFTRDDIYFVSAVANLRAIALENAWLHESIQKEVQACREELLEWRAEFGEEWVGQASDVVAHRWWEYI